MKYKFHIPTQQYGFLEIEGDSQTDILEAETLYNRYAETKLKFKKGEFIEELSLTGEKILYNELTHQYTDLQGNPLLSGSAYKKSLEAPFDVEKMSAMIGEKNGISPQTIADMWSMNGKISTTFGSALHYAMEQWYTHRENGCGEKEYHIAKHPFLREAVTTFPYLKEKAIPEALVSDVKNRRVGRIDLIVLDGEKKGRIIDYKSDADIKKNLKGHYNQLSFYAHILIAHGWSIPKLEVWNYAGKGWEKFESEVLEIIEK